MQQKYIRYIHPELRIFEIAVLGSEREQGHFSRSTEGVRGRSKGALASIEGALGEQGGAAQRRLKWLSHCPVIVARLAFAKLATK